MGVDPVLVEEAKRLRQKYYETKDYQGVYSEYLKSGHWEALKSEMVKARKRECEVCRSRNALNLHHLQYREWHDVWLDDLVWLCKKHHTLIHELGTPEGKDSYFLIRDTMRSLFEYENANLAKQFENKIETLNRSNASLLKELKQQTPVEPQVIYTQDPSLVRQIEELKKRETHLLGVLEYQERAKYPVVPSQDSNLNTNKLIKGVPLWITILAIAISFGAGWMLRPSTIQPEKAKPSRIERVK